MATAIDRFLSYKIRDVELESRFRADRLQYDIGQARILTALVFLLFLVFIFLDPLLSVGESHVFNANIARLVAAFACMMAFFLIGKVTTPRKFDLAMLLVVLVIDANVVILAVVSPAEFRTLIAWDILAIFVTYAFIPVTLSFQIATALFLSFSNAVVWLVFKNPDWPAFELGSTISLYVGTNIFGIYLAIRFKLYDRKGFLLLLREIEAKEQLETAMTEVNVLQGIIPICAHCKKIRNDDGIYEAAEDYIAKNTEADFSHTYCPVCIEKHYTQIDRDGRD